MRTGRPTVSIPIPHIQEVVAPLETVRDGSSQPAVRLGVRVPGTDGREVRRGPVGAGTRSTRPARCGRSPAARMKARREHRVPLCGRALVVLDAVRTLGDGGGLVFPMGSGRSIASSTLPKMLQYHEVAAVPHGFRSSFRDWASRNDRPSAGGHRSLLTCFSFCRTFSFHLHHYSFRTTLNCQIQRINLAII